MRRTAVAVCLFFFAATLSAATFDLPSDQTLLDRADLIVVATVLDAAGRQAADGMILTDYQLRVEDVVKGRAAQTIVVSEAGGLFNGRGVDIAGSAVYTPGTRVLTFLRKRADGTYYTAFMGLGKYRFKKQLLVRDADGIETIDGSDASDARNADAFVAAIRSGRPARARRITADAVRPDPQPRVDAAASAYVLTTGGPKRWKNCENPCTIEFTVNNGAHPVTNPIGGLENAFDAWTNHPNSFVNLEMAGVGGDTGRTNDDENDVVFNWDGSNPHSACEAAKGCGIVYFNGPPFTHVFRSETFNDVIAADVLVHQSVTTQLAYESILTHELGHALAFRHSNQGTPSGGGIMNSSVPTNLGATLDSWAQEALTAVYGPGVACVPPTITSTSGAGSVQSGQTKTLSVNVTGDAPFTYQWYEGLSGDTTTPVGTNSQSFTTPPITAPKNYWVKVSNGCPPVAASATITVTVAACTAPQITSESQSQEIISGSTTNLAVTATGTGPLTYRWYRANTVGDTSNQVATTASFTTPALTQATSYWARVSNHCTPNNHDDTALITITIAATCVMPAIGGQSPNLSVLQGEGATISVNPTGTAPFTYQWYQGDAPNDTQPIIGATGPSYAAGPFPTPGTFKFWAKVHNACGSVNSNTIAISVGCSEVVVPLVSAPAISHFSNGYNVSWTGNTALSTFEVQEATDAAFTQNVQTFPVTGALSRSIAPHLEITADTRFYYRVRAISVCTSQPSAWSNTASTVVTRPLPADSEQFAFSVPVGSVKAFTQDLLVPGFGETATNADTFSITLDVPWITVFPASGALSAGGTTVQLTINPTGLEAGSTTGTIQISRTNGAAGKGVATHDSAPPVSIPLGLSLVTPVSPDPRDGNPPPGTLIIPAVAHAQGIGSPFRSDVRIVNVSFSDVDYDISYTPSGLDGLQTGKKTTITIRSGDVLALDDIVASWYGAGMLGEGGIGTIEIRPLNSANPLDTFASSRTYALTGGGTLGQFIPALRTNQFIGNFAQDTLARISLQMIAASADYRTNVGFVEGTGSPVSFLARLVDGNNNILNVFNGSLPPYGHMQRSVPDLFGGVNLNDGRVEVEVMSSTGKVSAYASVLNNQTNDPLMVFPVQPARTTAERYVVAGIAELTGGSNFHSDMRIYNAGSSAVTATLNFYPFSSETPSVPAVQRTIDAGQVLAIDDVLPTLWPGLTGGGSVIATTDGPSSLVVTAQTFSLEPDGGTKGQFIPGVTFREAVGVGDRPLEILQLEQSDQYRSNVGFVEVTGKPAVIEVIAFEPDTKTSVVTQIPLKANEYTQYARFLSSMGLGTVYNGRVSVKVISGEGRVYAYGSNVDNRTSDPTYIPAQ